MKLRCLKTMRLRQQVLLAVIVPVTVLSFGLSAYFAYERYRHIEAHHRLVGEITCSDLAEGARFALYKGDLQRVEQLAATALTRPSVSAVTFYDAGDRILLHATRPPESADSAPLGPHETPPGEHWRFERPVVLEAPAISAFGEDGTASRVVGRVEVAVSRNAASQRTRQMLLATLLAAAGAILAGIAFAFKIGTLIGGPLQTLTRHVRRLEQGTSEGPAPERGPVETAILARGINQLSDRVAQQLKTQESRISEATSQLQRHNQELENTRNVLQKALRAKDAFLATISHELRTPLTAIIGYNRLLATTQDRDQALEYIRHIDHAATLLRSLINDVLDCSRLQSAALELERIPFDLEVCLEDIVGMHGHEAIEKQLELVLLVDADVPKAVIGDPPRLQQVFNNLLGNAIKFTERGEVVVQVGLERRDERTATLRCQIRDSGPGIATGDRERLFEPFVQGNPSIKQNYGGSGLGLAICRSLLHKMGGTIRLDSNIPGGTKVEFTFCLECPAAATPTDLPDNAAQVLAYDGHDWSRRALRNLLSRWSRNVSATGELDTFTAELHARSDLELVVISLSAAEAQRERLLALLRDVRGTYRGPLLLISAIPELQGQIMGADLPGPAPGFASRPMGRESLLARCDELLSRSTGPANPPAGTVDRPLHDLSILVAEDNMLIRTLILRILANAGAKVDAAESGADAVQACQRRAYDSVLLDIQMPGMDGIGAARRIRQIDGNLPIICVTAAISPLERQLLSWVEVDTILIKPVEGADLIAAVSAQCGRMEPATPAGPHSAAAPDRESFAAEIGRLLERAVQAQRDGDGAAFEADMHELMGLTGMIRGTALHALVRALKQEGFGLSPAEADHLFTEARTLLARLPGRTGD